MTYGHGCFRWLFLHENRGLEILWLFLILYKLSENQKKMIFHSILVLSRRCGLIQPPPLLSSNIQEPRSIRVKKINSFNLGCQRCTWWKCSGSKQWFQNDSLAWSPRGSLQHSNLSGNLDKAQGSSLGTHLRLRKKVHKKLTTLLWSTRIFCF